MLGIQLPRLGAPNSTPLALGSVAGQEPFSAETQLPRFGTPISVHPFNPLWPAWKGRP